MRVLFCHGLESGPGGFKPRALRSQGATVTAPDMAMSLWNPTKRNSVVLGLLSPRAMLTRWPSQWIGGALADSFEACVDVQHTALRDAGPAAFDVLIGSSWGGAVAAALIAEGAWTGPAVMLCPALSELRRHGAIEAIVDQIAALPAERKAQCLIVHGDADETIPVADSVKLCAATGIELEVIEGGNHGMGSVAADGRLLRFAERVVSSEA